MNNLSVFSILDTSPDCIKIVDKSGGILYINKAGLGFLEAPDDTNLIGSVVYELISPAHRNTWETNHLEVCNGESKTWEYEIIGFRGTKKILETYATPLLLPNGSKVQLAITKDITAKKIAELSARQSENKLIAITDAFHSMSGITDLHSVISAVTKHARLIIGSNVAATQIEGFQIHISTSDKYQASSSLINKFPDSIIARLKKENGDDYGYIQLSDKIEGAFTDTDAKILSQFADYASLKIESSRLWMELESREKLFRTLAENINNLAWSASSDGKINWYNQRWTEYTGIETEELIRNGWKSAIHPDYIRQMPTANTWDKKEPFEMIYPLKGQNGSYKWFLSRGVPIPDNKGNVKQWIGTLTNIDEQKRGEERFKAIADNAPLWMWLSDRDGNCDYCNQEMLYYFGLKHYTQLTPVLWSNRIHPDDQHLLDKISPRPSRNHEPNILEIRIKTASENEYEWFSIQTVSRFIGKFYDGYMAVANNITSQKLSANELENIIKERTIDLQLSNTALQNSNEQLERFAHIASHDLKEPVRKIRMYANMLQKNLSDAGDHKLMTYVNKIDASSKRMNDLIEGILKYASLNIEATAPEYIDLNHIFTEVLSDLEVVIQSKNVEIIKRNELPCIYGTGILVNQVIYNLINNAIKFSRTTERCRIEVFSEYLSNKEVEAFSLTSDKEYLMLSIKDNGIGFDQSQADKIFQPYSRLHARDVFEGSGLGLAICTRIIQQHKGIIWAEGIPGKGSTFKIVLPVQ
jgi:PAS domain S-box-containing protein